MPGDARAGDGAAAPAAAAGRKATLRGAKHPFSGDRLFAWALGAPYHQTVGHPVDGLDAEDRVGSWKPSAFFWRRIARIGLSRSWGVRDRKGLIAAMGQLGSDGRRYSQREELDEFLALSPRGIAAWRTEATAKAEEDGEAEGARRVLWLLDLVERNADWLQRAPLLAFDAARGVMLAREGLVFKWLSDEEAWGYLLPLAAAAAGAYRSWEEYGRDFLIGRDLWAGQASGEDEYVRAVAALLSDEASPWRRVPFALAGTEAQHPPRPGAPAWLPRDGAGQAAA